MNGYLGKGINVSSSALSLAHQQRYTEGMQVFANISPLNDCNVYEFGDSVHDGGTWCNKICVLISYETKTLKNKINTCQAPHDAMQHDMIHMLCIMTWYTTWHDTQWFNVFTITIYIHTAWCVALSTIARDIIPYRVIQWNKTHNTDTYRVALTQ